MEKLLTALSLLLLATILTACVPTTTAMPSLTEPTEIPPTNTPSPKATLIPTPACDPLVYNEPEFIGTTSGDAHLAWLASSDVTGDGYSDLFLARSEGVTLNTFEIEIWRNDGQGSLEKATSDIFEGPIPAVQTPRGVIFEDFNGDGNTDIFIADHGQDTDPFPGHQNSLALSAQGGKLVDATANLPQQSDFTHSAAAGDVDGDGDIDLYVGNFSFRGPNQILLNDGVGDFSASIERLPAEVTQPTENYTAAAFVDVNDDSFPDLILGGFIDAESKVLINDGSGYFFVLPGALPPKPIHAENQVLDFEAADINADGYLDLLAAFTIDFYEGRYIQFLVNNGDGTFRDETALRFPQEDNDDSWPIDIQLHDIDYDGDLDLVMMDVGYPSPDIQPFYLNNGAWIFSEAKITHHITEREFFTLLDLEADGYLDLLTTDCKEAGAGGNWCAVWNIYIIHDIGCK